MDQQARNSLDGVFFLARFVRGAGGGHVTAMTGSLVRGVDGVHSFAVLTAFTGSRR
jgi:hypothetical protein